MLRKINHGEVLFLEVQEIPEGAKKIEVKESFFVVGESETHGNDHRIAVDDRTSLFTKEDVLFLNSIGTEIYCPNKHRHDTITLPEGKWQIGHAKEYDYFSENLRKVRD